MKEWPKKLSPAMTIMRTLWDHRLDETGHSWTRLNGALSGVLSDTIIAGVPFGPDDFAIMATFMRIGYWFGEDNGERFYTAACSVKNLTACESFENWKARPAFILHGHRLCIGARINPDMTEVVTPSCRFYHSDKNSRDWSVTSFRAATASKPEAVNLTRYKAEPSPNGGHNLKLAGRTSLDRAKITELQAKVRAAKKATKEKPVEAEESAA